MIDENKLLEYLYDGYEREKIAEDKARKLGQEKRMIETSYGKAVYSRVIHRVRNGEFDI